VREQTRLFMIGDFFNELNEMILEVVVDVREYPKPILIGKDIKIILDKRTSIKQENYILN